VVADNRWVAVIADNRRIAVVTNDGPRTFCDLRATRSVGDIARIAHRSWLPRAIYRRATSGSSMIADNRWVSVVANLGPSLRRNRIDDHPRPLDLWCCAGGLAVFPAGIDGGRLSRLTSAVAVLIVVAMAESRPRLRHQNE
jgi:hypothetical protein